MIHNPPAGFHYGNPDPRPGNYYVSVCRGDQYVLLRGPFASHAAALGAVQETMRKACDLDPRGHWYAYGTARLHDGEAPKPGKLNSHF
jgi:hypothetical protein